MNEFRVMVAEADYATAALLVAQVEQLGHIVIEEVRESATLLELARLKRPDAVILPWRAVGAAGPDCTIQKLARTFPSMHVVARVDQQCASDRYEAIAAGAWACIPLFPSTMEMMTALEQERTSQAVPPSRVAADPDTRDESSSEAVGKPEFASAAMGPTPSERPLTTAGGSMLKRVIG